MSDAANHVESTVQQMAELHSEQEKRSSQLQRSLSVATSSLGQPVVLFVIIALEGLWIAMNLAPKVFHVQAFDAPTFSTLNLIVSTLALNATVLILSTQRRDDLAARRRAQLTLQLASLSEQKIAKVIALLEEQRRDNPALPNHSDRQADEMSMATDPKHVLDRIIDTHEGAD